MGILGKVAVLIAFSASMFQACGDASATTIVVTAESDRPILAPGETTTIAVKALVEEPASANDGIFTFDLDMILDDSSVVSIVSDSVSRPGTDDASFGGSDGTLVFWGIDAIAGGYWDLDAGIDTPQTLFTFDVESIAFGNALLTAGPDTDIMGDDFVLNESTSYGIDYSGASAAISVVPEPTAVALLFSGIATMLFTCPRGRLAARRSS